MDRDFKYQNKTIFYRVTGNGKPVMLLHGFGEDGEIWKKQEAFLSTKYKLIIPDLPGSGKSEMIDDMSIEGMMEVVHSVIHEEELHACIMISHSMGGYITLAFAEKYRNHLAGFGLFHSSAFPDSEEKKTARQKSIAFIKEHGAFEFLKTAIPNLFAPASKTTIPGSIKKLIDRGNNFTPGALVSYYKAMIMRPDRTEILEKETLPVLFIMGKYDNAVPLEDGLKQCHLPEKSYIHILHQSGHMGMLEETENSNRILDEFLLET